MWIKCAATTTSIQWPIFQDNLSKLAPERYTKSAVFELSMWWFGGSERI